MTCVCVRSSMVLMHTTSTWSRVLTICEGAAFHETMNNHNLTLWKTHTAIRISVIWLLDNMPFVPSVTYYI